MNVRELLAFIKNLSNDVKDCNEYRQAKNHGRLRWGELINNDKDWELIINTKIVNKEVLEDLLDIGGTSLAIKWINSDDELKKEAALIFFVSDLKRIDEAIWKQLPKNERFKIIEHYATKNINYATKNITKEIDIYSDRDSVRDNLLVTSYNLAKLDLFKLKRIAESVNDTESIDFINKFRDEIECIIETVCLNEHNEYRLNDIERLLIAKAIKIFVKFGFRPEKLPKIIYSNETPPLFVLYPHLYDDIITDNNKQNRSEYCEKLRDKFEKDYGDKEGGDIVKRLCEKEDDFKPRHYNIEELLGCYYPREVKIVLFKKGIEWCSNKLNVDKKHLIAVVLIHEIAHWITHLLPHEDSKEWEVNSYINTSSDIHEGLAQLITYYISNIVNGSFKKAFDELNKNQSLPYLVYKNFINLPEEKIINSLVEMRKLNSPISLEQWEKIVSLK